MDWKKTLLSLAIMAAAYFVGYVSSYFFSKRYAEKRAKEECEKDEKQK